MNELYTHIQYLIFYILILKVVVVYFEPSLVIVLKGSKCMCISYIIINPWPLWIEIYEYFNEYIICAHLFMHSVLLFL